jgi:mediator of RNA polymerase II transcription subunit 5
VSFTRAFTYQLLSLGLLDQTFAVRIDPSLSGASPSHLQTEAREAGVDFGVSGLRYAESWLITRSSIILIRSFLLT